MSRFSKDFRRAQEGDPSALGRIYEAHSPGVMRLIRRRINSTLRRIYDTVDIAQSVFLELVRDLSHLEDRGSPAFGRLLRMKAESKVNSKFRKHLRASGGRREQTLIDLERATGNPGPHTTAMRREETQSVRRSLADLSERDRSALLLRTVERRSHREVAEALDLGTEDAARKLHARALLRLRALWKKA